MKPRFPLFALIFLSGYGYAGSISPFFSPNPLSHSQNSSQSPKSPKSDSRPRESFIPRVNQSRTGLSQNFTGGYNPDLHYATYQAEKLTITGEKSEFKLALFYSEKDISMLDPCTKSNYLLALHTLDGKIISPGETFNLNTHLANLRGYCTGRGAKTFTFYGGVCGVSSQLFRAGLSSPQVRIDKRHGHNERYSKYYGAEVDGDDAAVYEWSKQFAFTNISDAPLLIKTLQRGDQTWLFFITEQSAVAGKRVEISKTQKSPLAVDISKTIYRSAKAENIKCKNLTSQLFSPQKLDCQEQHLTEEISSQHFQSRYFKILNRSL